MLFKSYRKKFLILFQFLQLWLNQIVKEFQLFQYLMKRKENVRTPTMTANTHPKSGKAKMNLLNAVININIDIKYIF